MKHPWHTVCHLVGMKINATILKDISSQVSHGNSLWGIAVANEYLDKGDPIRSALVKKAESRYAKDGSNFPLEIKLLMNGCTCEQLSIAAQAQIGAKRPLKSTHLLNLSRVHFSSRMQTRIKLRSQSSSAPPFLQYEASTTSRKLS